jgi:hypothetical protein
VGRQAFDLAGGQVRLGEPQRIGGRIDPGEQPLAAGLDRRLSLSVNFGFPPISVTQPLLPGWLFLPHCSRSLTALKVSGGRLWVLRYNCAGTIAQVQLRSLEQSSECR